MWERHITRITISHNNNNFHFSQLQQLNNDFCNPLYFITLYNFKNHFYKHYTYTPVSWNMKIYIF